VLPNLLFVRLATLRLRCPPLHAPAFSLSPPSACSFLLILILHLFLFLLLPFSLLLLIFLFYLLRFLYPLAFLPLDRGYTFLLIVFRFLSEVCYHEQKSVRGTSVDAFQT